LNTQNTTALSTAALADVATWPAEWSENFEERAAIMEHDGGLSRADAEVEAWRLLRGRNTTAENGKQDE
jgi:hypothetical protein